MSNIKFENPWVLFLIIPFVIGIVLPFIFIKKGKSRTKNILSLIFHLGICVLLTLAGANIQILHSTKNTELYVLADVSDSNFDQYEKMDSIIQDLSRQIDKGTKMGVICYGKNCEILTPLGESIQTISLSNVDCSATNLESALRFTNEQFSDNVIKKIILLSDGQETDNHALRALDELRANQVEIDALYLEKPNLESEIQIHAVDFTPIAYLDREETVRVAIQSGVSQRVTISLLLNHEEIEQTTQNLPRGISIVDFSLKTDEKNVHSYEVKISPEIDTFEQNNHFYFTQKITDEFHVLAIGRTFSDCTDATDLLYDSNTSIDYYFNNEEIPYSLTDLCTYDEIVLSNYNVVGSKHHEEFVRNLDIFVSKLGKSLITFGPTYASGTSNENMTKYNNMLPIQFEPSEAKCLALVIDSSGSMEMDNRLSKAVEGAIACLDLLGEKDYVTIISFGDNTKVLQPLTSAKNRDQIIRSIQTIYSYGMTNMTRGLQEAYYQIRNANFDDKQVILLSDGQPTETGYETSLPSIVETMANHNIATSFINIACKEGEPLLKSLANVGNGSYYFINHSADIVDVVLTSVADVVTNIRIEGDFAIDIHKKNDILLKDVGSLPNIKGYNFCRVKGSADTVLTVEYTNELGGVRNVPLLAHWEYGKGKVISFTSDIHSSWTNDFKESENGKKLMQNISSYSVPEERIDSLYQVDITTNGFSLDLDIRLDFYFEQAYLETQMISPSGEVTQRYFRNTNTRYTFTNQAEEYGVYTLKLIYHNGNETYEDTKYFAFSYSSEYHFFSINDEELLYQLVGDTGVVSNSLEYSLSVNEATSRYYESIHLYLLLPALILFILDIIIRKFQISDLKIKRS